jgi:copper chaperone CopZ
MSVQGNARVTGPEPGEPEASLRMKIGGMSCSFCTSTIRTAYERMDGVHEVGISLAHEEELVRYDPTRVSQDHLKQTLRDVGYTYRDPDKVASFEKEAELRHARVRLLLAGSLTAVTLVLLMLGMFGIVTTPYLAWVMLTLALRTMFVTAWFVKKMAFVSIRHRIVNQHEARARRVRRPARRAPGLFVSPVFPANHFFAVATAGLLHAVAFCRGAGSPFCEHAYGKVGGVLVTGNEDGIKHIAMNVLHSLQHLGNLIPPQADAGWIGEAGPGPSYLDEGSGGPGNAFTERNTRIMTWNLMHLAGMLKRCGGLPTEGNQREQVTEETETQHPNPEYR